MSVVSLVGVFGDRPTVRVAFSDEFGANDDQFITVVAGVLLNLDEQYDPLIADIEKALTEAFQDSGKATDFEIKGAGLASYLRKGQTKGALAQAIITGVLSLATRHQFPIFYGAFERAGYRKIEEYLRNLRQPLQKIWRTGVRPDPAFVDCLDRVNRYVSTLVPPEKILWIHDHAGAMTVPKHVELAWRRMAEIRHLYQEELQKERQFSFGIGKAGPSIQTPNIRIVDSVYFGDSASSRLIEFADLCCSVIGAHLLVTHKYIQTDDKDAVLAPFYPLIQDAVTNDSTPPVFSKARTW